MLFLKQSTAVTVKIGPFVDETDGKTAETELTISQGDVRLSKNGGDIAQKNDADACTHDEVGIYNCTLNTTDTGTLGVLQLWVHESGARPVWHEYMVCPANVWDSMFGADRLSVDVEEIGANIITAAAIADAAIDNATFAADVGSTVYATNIIALAVRKVLDALNLDHLCLTATGGTDMTTEVADNTILSRIIGNGDTSTFVPSTDGLHAAGVDLDAVLDDTGTTGVILADNAISVNKIATTGANRIADQVLRRSFENAADSAYGDVKGFRSLLGAVARLVNRVRLNAGTLTVYEDDDSTALGTQTVTTDAAAEPVTEVNTD